MNMMLKYWSLSMIVLLGFFMISCEEVPSIDISKEDLLPIPRDVKATNESFEITADTKINLVSIDKDLSPLVDYFNEQISTATGFKLETRTLAAPAKGINFVVFNEGDVNDSYELEIDRDKVVITADTASGVFNGIQTMLQLLPDRIESNSKEEGPWLMGTGYIRDNGRYPYRGVMLDVARHFFSVDDVKKVIDHIAHYKYNKLHLHLSDDQGWRIEIKSWPKLTEIGGSTEVGGGEGGFYTQEEYKDIVAYAASRYIEIIPEIDMPGHTNAALASYPELNCNNKTTDLYTGTEVGFSTFCTDKEEVYQFVDDVVREISEISPGQYFHIGGDESHATAEDDYIYFIERVQKIVTKYGKTVIGWDEIANTKMEEGALAQFWATEENVKKALLQDKKIIMSPAKRIYLDMQYDSTTQWGLHWAAYIEVDSSYTWDPGSYVNGLNSKMVWGVEAPLWSETVTNLDEIEYMIFPRMIAASEVAWSRQNRKNWEEFRIRLAKHSDRLDTRGINYYKSPRIDWDKDYSLDEGEPSEE